MANTVTVSGPYSPSSWVNGSTPLNQTHMANLEGQAGIALKGFNGDLLTAFVESGMVCTKDGSVANQLDVSAGTAYPKMSDGTLGQITATASTAGQFTTSTPSTTYYLFLQNTGVYQWGTSSSQPTNSLWLCQATTDGSGNILVVTDKRTTITTLLSGAASPVALPMLYTDKGLLMSDGLGTVSGQAPSTPSAPSVATATNTTTQTYAALVASLTPSRYYRLDESSGTTVNDTSGNAQNGTTHASPTQGVAGLLTGDTDNCYTFVKASSQFISCPVTGLPTGNSAFSLAAWFKFAANPASNAVIYCYLGSGTHNGVEMYIDTSGKLNVLIPGGTGSIVSPSAVSTGAAHLGAVTWDGTTLTLYLDGVSVGTLTPGAMTVSSPTMDIGADGSNFWGGQIDDCAFFSSALSSTNISNLYTIGTNGPDSLTLPGVGTYMYEVSYATAASETAPGASASITTTTGHQKVSLTSIPLGPNGTTKRNIYRTVLGGSAYLLLAAINDNTTTSYTDQIADNALGAAVATHPTAGGDIWKNAAGTTVAQVFGDGYARFAGVTSGPNAAGQATAAGSLGLLPIVAQTVDQAISGTGAVDVLAFAIPANGLYMICASFYIGRSGTSVITFAVQANAGDNPALIPSYQLLLQSGTLLNAASVAGAGQWHCQPALFYAAAGHNLDIHYSDATATVADLVTVVVVRLA